MNSEFRRAADVMIATLVPADEMKRQMAMDSLKIGFVAGDQSSANAACRQCNQNIHGQVAHLGTVEVVALPHRVQNFRSLNPVSFSRSKDVAPIHQVRHKPLFNPRSRATKEFVKHDRRAAHDELRLENPKGETPGSEVFNVNRGIQNAELNCA